MMTCYLAQILVIVFILIRVPYIFCYFVLWPTNAQLFYKLLHSHMFRHKPM